MAGNDHQSPHRPSRAPSKARGRAYDERDDYEPEVQKSFASQNFGRPTVREISNAYNGPAPSPHGRSYRPQSESALTISSKSSYGSPEGVPAHDCRTLATSHYSGAPNNPSRQSIVPSNREAREVHSTELHRDDRSPAENGKTILSFSSVSESASRDQYPPDRSGQGTKAHLGTKLQRDGSPSGHSLSKPSCTLPSRDDSGRTERERCYNYQNSTASPSPSRIVSINTLETERRSTVAPSHAPSMRGSTHQVADNYASSKMLDRYVLSKTESGKVLSKYKYSITPALRGPPPNISSFMTSKHDIDMSARQLDRELMAGEEAKFQDEWVQKKIKEMPLCPDNNPWMKRPEGYQCQMEIKGRLIPGGHAITDALIEEGRGGIFSVQGHFSKEFLWPNEGGELLGPYYKDEIAVTDEEKKQWYQKADLEKLATKREKARFEKTAEREAEIIEDQYEIEEFE